MATEEPKFETMSRHGNIELRRYAPFVVAETFVEGDLTRIWQRLPRHC